jgi:hypothetical protein
MKHLLVIGAFAAVLTAGVVDRVAVVAGKTVILESEVLQELRITAFLNGQSPDTSPEQRRAAAERLVDQALIRDEMEIGRYPQPSEAEAGELLGQFRRENYPNGAAFSAVLNKYGITEEQLRRRLLWQAAALRFTEVRFKPAVTQALDPQSANRESDAEAGDPVQREMEAWLKDKRANTRVQFKKEAFQ